MREFVSLERYTIRDRQVVTVALDQEEDREGLLAKLRAEGGVMIDGKHHDVDGFESFAITPLRKGMRIGLSLISSAPASEGSK